MRRKGRCSLKKEGIRIQGMKRKEKFHRRFYVGIPGRVEGSEGQEKSGR